MNQAVVKIEMIKKKRSLIVSSSAPSPKMDIFPIDLLISKTSATSQLCKF